MHTQRGTHRVRVACDVAEALVWNMLRYQYVCSGFRSRLEAPPASAENPSLEALTPVNAKCCCMTSNEMNGLGLSRSDVASAVYKSMLVCHVVLR